MPNLTNKGIDAMHYILKFYNSTDSFSASDLSVKCGEKFVAATLNALVSHNLLIKYDDISPIHYSMVDDCATIFENLLQNHSSSTKSGNNNENLHNALKNKDDEFYTYYTDVEAEVSHYLHHFIDKTVFLNCNDADDDKSAFWDYFIKNFDILRLKKLIATSYNP